MTRQRSSVLLILGASILGCAVMALVDAVWQPGYLIKSGIKLVLFLLLPLICARLNTGVELRPLFRPDRRALKLAALLGGGVFALILTAYFTIGRFFDLSAITSALTAGVGVTGDNFLFVALYISFVNSLLEEFFFRGFLFLGLLRQTSRPFSYTVSAALFALYHIAMMIGWGSPALIGLILAGLAAGALIFNRLNEASGCIYPSWLVHLCANLAINTIGIMLFRA